MEEMALREFVSSTLLQDVQGTADAFAKMTEAGNAEIRPYVNPRETHANHAATVGVAFDVAVTVTSGIEGNAKAGIKVGAFSSVAALPRRTRTKR